MKRIMIDLETFGPHGLAIAAIGAVGFRAAPFELLNVFYCNVLTEGGQDDSTIRWWLEQDEEARAALLDRPAFLDCALQDFARFYKGTNPNEIWSHEYDRRLLRQAYEIKEIKCPFHYREERDLRTIDAWFRRAKGPGPKSESKHNAQADAMEQAVRLNGYLVAREAFFGREASNE